MTNEGAGDGRVPAVGIALTGLVLVGLTLLLTYSLVQLWPSQVPTSTGGNAGTIPTGSSVGYLWWTISSLPRETSLFIAVLSAGAIGGCIHSLRSLYWYVGNRNLRYSWLLMYFSLPIVGAMMALVTYLVLRGGLTTAVAGSQDINPFGLAGVSALVGLFSREAAEKLRLVFETLLTSAEKGKDQVVISSIDAFAPSRGGPGTSVIIKGTGLSAVTDIRFGTGVSTPLVVSDTELTAAVPVDATTGRITIVTPMGTAQSPGDFDVLPAAETPAPPAALVVSVTPTAGQPEDIITIAGAGLADATEVRIGEGSTTPEVRSDTELRVTVPASATTGRLVVVTRWGSVESPEDFTVFSPTRSHGKGDRGFRRRIARDRRGERT